MGNVSAYFRLLACLVCGGGFFLAALLAISLARLSSLISQAEEARAIAALVKRDEVGKSDLFQ